jgi:hypothetical protein
MNLIAIEGRSADASGHDSPLQSDAILPVQFHPARRGTSETEPVRRLMFAILVDAVRCFQANVSAHAAVRRRLFWEARLWIFSEKGGGPFSFDNVCGALDVDPRGLRRWLLDWREKRLGGGKVRIIRRTPIKATRPIQSRTSSKHAALRLE